MQQYVDHTHAVWLFDWLCTYGSGAEGTEGMCTAIEVGRAD